MDIWLKVILIKRLVPDPKMEIRNGEEIIWNDERSMPTDSELLEELNKFNDEMKKLELYKKIDKFADTKTKEAKNYIAGKTVTDEQLLRYERKYEMAKAYKTDGSYKDELSWEAELTGITVDELADLIVNTAMVYNKELNSTIAKIEAFRVKLGNWVKAGKYNNVESILAEAYKLPVDVSIDEIKNLIAKYESSSE